MEFGETDWEPEVFGVWEPSVVMVKVEALLEVQCTTVELYFWMGLVSKVTAQVGAGVTVKDAEYDPAPPAPVVVHE